MKFREFIKYLEKNKKLNIEISPISLKYELAKRIYDSKEIPTLFTNIKETKDWKIVSGLCSERELIAKALEISKEKLLYKLADAFENPTKPPIIEKGVCQEEIIEKENIDLTKLPIPKFLPKDGGHYITAGIMIIKDPDTGLNASYHRLMVIDKNKFTLRLVEKRQAHTTYLKHINKNKKMEVAICIGNSMAVMIASSMSPKSGIFELEIANSLETTPLTKCKTKDLLVPGDCEVVLEGYITKETHKEGPFVDLTGTYDIIREQPVLEIDCITHRKEPIFQVLLPGNREHKLLMGMPKEPMIYSAVNKEVICKNVILTEGGGCWLHSAIQIQKKNDDEPKKAIDLAFKAHKSLKHVIIVDEDINIYDNKSLEWALATRFQGDKDLVILPNQPSSSLDPSALHIPGEKSKTTKLGFDATIPLDKDKEKFIPVNY